MTGAMYLLFAAAADGPSSPFDVTSGLFIWTWVVFITLVLLLRKYAWPAIVSATVEREQRIAAALARAEQAQTDAAAALEEGKRFAAEARASAQSLMAEARTSAEKERAGLLEKAKQEQEDILARARREIGAEKEKALAELRREAVDLSLAAAAKLVGRRLDTEADRRLVREYLDTVEIVH